MFNDRDLAVISFGALTAVCCLLLPFPFAVKVAVGLVVLLSATLAAFLRLDRDRLTLEEWFVRRIRFAIRPKIWTYRSKNLTGVSFSPQLHVSVTRPDDTEDEHPVIAVESIQDQMAFTLGSVSSERLASILLVVVGAYFVSWLWAEGAWQIGVDMGLFLP